MDPVLVGLGLVGLFSAFALGRRAVSTESFGHHLPDGVSGFRHVRKDGAWDVYEYSGRSGAFLVSMYPDVDGRYPFPGRTNVDYVYPDGVEARVVRALGPSGCKWAELDLPGSRSYDLFVYHPANHPEIFPGVGFGAVSGWMGGRGPGAGTGLSSGGGGRHHGNPYDWSGPVSSGGFRRWRNPDESIEVPGEVPLEDEGLSFGEDGQIEDEESGQVWSPRFGWVSPAERDAYGINLLGINIPTSRAERVERLEAKIANAEDKIADFEEEAKEEGADLEKLAKQIASLQTQKERWEDKKNKIEIRMGEDSFGLDSADEMFDGEDDGIDLDDLVGEEFGEELFGAH